MTRIEQTFQALKAKGRTGIVTYVTVGFPNIAATMDIVPALVEGGADMIELGVPFSDPLADGATIQRSSQVALQNGVTLSDCLDVCKRLRARLPTTPFLFMGYYNPIYTYGIARFAQDAHAAGADGVIVPDLPPEEAAALRAACDAEQIDVVFLIAPTSTDDRIASVGKASKGFLYCVSLTGVTGARRDVAVDLPGFLAKARKHATVPLAVGFGISTAEHVRSIGKVADAVIIGSALIAEIETAGAKDGAAKAKAFVQRVSAGAVKG